MKREDINIRDPYILVNDSTYYLYGTRAKTCWGKADGFDCYVSRDLENWEGPIEIFKRSPEFWADQNFWAPECVEFNGAFYLITTLGSEDRKKGVYALKADHPTGPFVEYSSCLTPVDWTCIDGSLYIENGKPYLVFSHSFEDTPDGDMCYVELSDDLKTAVGMPVKMFSAVEANWANPVPFAKAEFGMDGDVYFTDGPCLMKLEDQHLYMTWSSWSVAGYAVGVAVSESGNIAGPWIQREIPIYPENGGHGMMFVDMDGQLKFTLHSPNDFYKERPHFMNLNLKDGNLYLE